MEDPMWDAADLRLRTSGDPTLSAASLQEPLSHEVRALLNLLDRAEAARDIQELRSVVMDVIAHLVEETSRRTSHL